MSEPVSYTTMVSIAAEQLTKFLSETITYSQNMQSLIDWWEPEQFTRELSSNTPLEHYCRAIDGLDDDYNILIVGYDDENELLYVRHEYNHDWYAYLEDELSLWGLLSRFKKKTTHKEYAFVSLFPPWGYGLGEQYIALEFQEQGLRRIEKESIPDFSGLEQRIYQADWHYGKDFFKSMPADVDNGIFKKHYLEHPLVLPEIIEYCRSRCLST